MSKQSTKENLIALALVGVLVIGAIVVVYIPQGKKLDKLGTQIATEDRHLVEESKKTLIVPALFRHVNLMRSRYRNFDRRLPKRKELGGFLQEISSHLADRDLSSQLIEPGDPTKEELFHTLPIIMKFKGSYLALAKLLERIDKMERLTRIQKLSIKRSTKEKDKGVLDIELCLNIYFTES